MVFVSSNKSFNELQWTDIVGLGPSAESHCPICYNDFKWPQVAACGHVFCFTCMLKNMVTGQHTPARCPICRQATSIADLKLMLSVKPDEIKIGHRVNFVLLNCLAELFPPKSFKEGGIIQFVSNTEAHAMCMSFSRRSNTRRSNRQHGRVGPYVTCARMFLEERAQKYANQHITFGTTETRSESTLLYKVISSLNMYMHPKSQRTILRNYGLERLPNRMEMTIRKIHDVHLTDEYKTKNPMFKTMHTGTRILQLEVFV